MFLGKNDRPDVHFVRPSAFIVWTASSARFYLADAVLLADGLLLHLCTVKLRPRGRVSASTWTAASMRTRAPSAQSREKNKKFRLYRLVSTSARTQQKKYFLFYFIFTFIFIFPSVQIHLCTYVFPWWLEMRMGG
jgi:hypothetical protein